MKKSLLPLSLILIAAAVSANNTLARAATDNQDVVRASNGTIVTNSTGECVRTRWNAGGDACGPVVAQQTAQTTIITPHKHAELGEEQRTIYFNFNKSDLTPAARTKLDSLTQVLKSEDDVKEAKIVGYADRIGSVPYNDRLSQARAEAVKDYIVSHGYANASVAETRWVGKSSPITSCSNNMKHSELVKCLQADRRVEVEINYAETVSDNR
jgi:OOP family OmpA-OmpF porin